MWLTRSTVITRLTQYGRIGRDMGNGNSKIIVGNGSRSSITGLSGQYVEVASSIDLQTTGNEIRCNVVETEVKEASSVLSSKGAEQGLMVIDGSMIEEQGLRLDQVEKDAIEFEFGEL